MPQLDKNRIAAAAIAVLDKRGVRGFTIRGVATALGVTPMALYHHVRNKAELAALVVSATTSKNPLAMPTGDWRKDVMATARWLRELSSAHPAVQELRRTYRIYTPDMLQMAERWPALWQQSGLDLERAAMAARTSSMMLGGFIAEEQFLRDIDKPSAAAMARLPNARRLFRAPHDPDAVFDLAVGAIIDGLLARLMKSVKPAKKRSRRK